MTHTQTQVCTAIWGTMHSQSVIFLGILTPSHVQSFVFSGVILFVCNASITMWLSYGQLWHQTLITHLGAFELILKISYFGRWCFFQFQNILPRTSCFQTMLSLWPISQGVCGSGQRAQAHMTRTLPAGWKVCSRGPDHSESTHCSGCIEFCSILSVFFL